MSHTFTCSLHTLLVYLVAPPAQTLMSNLFFCAFNISHSACLRGYRTHLLCYWSLSLAFFFPIFTIVISEETRWTVEPSLALFFNLFFFFGQKFSCTERSKVNVSLFREMEVLQIVSQSLI